MMESHYEEFRDRMVAENKNIAMVAMVNMDKTTRFYGPFANGQDAMNWLARQPSGIVFQFIPLRNPNLARQKIDFYAPDSLFDEREFDKDSHIKSPTDEYPQMVFIFDENNQQQETGE